MNNNLKSKLKLANNIERKTENNIERKIENNIERKCCGEQTNIFFTMKIYDNNIIEFTIKPSEHLNIENNIKIDKIFFINLTTYKIIDFCDIIFDNNLNNLCNLKISVKKDLYNTIKPSKLQINYTIEDKKFSIDGYYIENKFIYNSEKI